MAKGNYPTKISSLGITVEHPIELLPETNAWKMELQNEFKELLTGRKGGEQGGRALTVQEMQERSKRAMAYLAGRGITVPEEWGSPGNHVVLAACCTSFAQALSESKGSRGNYCAHLIMECHTTTTHPATWQPLPVQRCDHLIPLLVSMVGGKGMAGWIGKLTDSNWAQEAEMLLTCRHVLRDHGEGQSAQAIDKAISTAQGHHLLRWFRTLVDWDEYGSRDESLMVEILKRIPKDGACMATMRGKHGNWGYSPSSLDAHYLGHLIATTQSPQVFEKAMDVALAFASTESPAPLLYPNGDGGNPQADLALKRLLDHVQIKGQEALREGADPLSSFMLSHTRPLGSSTNEFAAALRDLHGQIREGKDLSSWSVGIVL